VGTNFTSRGWREFLLVCGIGTALAVALTYPFASQMDRVGRSENSDGQFSIWNVSWVARTIVADPSKLFDANIFYPHQKALTFSEHNLAAGIMAVPVYWATRNPYLALNSVFLAAMVLSVAGGYYLVRYLTQDRRAAMLAGVCFAFCPYIFGRTSHIQLLLTAGLPFSLLAFHRMADGPTPLRGAVLGLVVAAQATASGYYAILTVLLVVVATMIVAATRQLWRDASYWGAVASAALVTFACVVPLFVPYLQLQRDTGFERPLNEAAIYSADWRAYLASSALGHRWMLGLIGRWNEVLFPGFVATLGGIAGAWAGWRRAGRARETAVLYGSLAIIAGWASLGPDAGLYSALYHSVPVLTWLRAPARFGIAVALALSVLAGLAISEWLPRVRRANALAALVIAIAAAELITPLRFREAPPFASAYDVLAGLPPGPVIELPFPSREADLHGHAKYMLRSTAHWMPLINGYSDYIPRDFAARAHVLRGFPSRDAFRILAAAPPRYAMFHPQSYQNEALLNARLKEFSSCLRPIHVEGSAHLYEVLDCALMASTGAD
jgi:hypothetical protein